MGLNEFAFLGVQRTPVVLMVPRNALVSAAVTSLRGKRTLLSTVRVRLNSLTFT